MSIRIITDSTVDIAPAYEKKIAAVVPMTIAFGEEEYIDGITINKKEFYDRLTGSEELPKTSQATPDAFIKVFEELTARGESAVVITVSSKLSGTYQSARIAAEDFPNVQVVDSRNVSIGSGVLAQYACRCVEQGMGLEELTQHLIQKREEIGLVALVDTLKYLKKGGRISGTAAIAGEILNIKPVITVQDGEIAILGKARGSKKANNFLVEQIGKSGVNYEMPILLGYTGNSDEMLQNYVHDSQCLWKGHVEQLDHVQIGSVVGTHAGPGAVAVAYFKEH